MPSSPPVIQLSVPYRHSAVRQSSLLRIMQTAGSQPSTGSNSSPPNGDQEDNHDEGNESDVGPDEFLRSPATKTRSYRPRSKTYTYIESEADPPTPPSQPSQPNHEQGSSPPFMLFPDPTAGLPFGSAAKLPAERHSRLNVHSSPSRPETEISSPLTLPPPFSISRRTSSLQFSLPDRTRLSTPVTVDQDGHPGQSSSLDPTNVPANVGRLDTGVIHFPVTQSLPSTSPDRPVTSPPEEQPSEIALMPGRFPSTPTRADTSPRQPSSSFSTSPGTSIRAPPQTEPHNRNRHNNGGSFGVYNDFLPPETQPQTPADLQSSRRRAVAERNPAYTAPPGQIRTVGRLLGADHDGEHFGAQSPTVRTARMRERRAREFERWRSARMEALREAGGGRAMEPEEGDADTGTDLGTDFDFDLGGTITPEFAGQRLRFDGQDGETEQTDRRLVTEWRQFSRSRRPREVDWRSGFDEDRVGDENF